MTRLLDIIFSGIALIALSPLLLPLVIVLRFSGEGEVFFKQDRVGRGGHYFSLYKFATMLKDSPNMGTGTVTLKNDPRILPLGRFLRKTKMNELPQLINIFLGEMSFVGPRPFVIKHDLYEKEFLDRFLVLPGLTGWAQVNGRNSIPWKRKFELDCWYVRNISFRLDFSILLKTLFVLFDHRSVSADGHATFPEFKK